MQTIAQQVFYGLLVELIIVILTVRFKDKPEAAILILAVGTLGAAVVAFFPFQIQSQIDNPIQSISVVTQFPNNDTSTPYQTSPTSTKMVEEAAEDNSNNWGGILSVRMPTLNEIRQDMLSIWDANQLSLGDMLSPDIRSLSGTAQKEKEYLWPIYWCSKDQATLANNVENITTVFMVNGEIVPSEYIFDYYYDTNTGWKCNYHATVIGRWPSNVQLILQVKRTFATQINDGQQSYPAGDYIYELNISVK